MKHSIQERIVKENRLSYGIQVTSFDNGVEYNKFVIPVIDVRDGQQERNRVNRIIKANNQSKFTKPSYSVIGKSYQVSHKNVS